MSCPYCGSDSTACCDKMLQSIADSETANQQPFYHSAEVLFRGRGISMTRQQEAELRDIITQYLKSTLGGKVDDIQVLYIEPEPGDPADLL